MGKKVVGIIATTLCVAVLFVGSLWVLDWLGGPNFREGWAAVNAWTETQDSVRFRNWFAYSFWKGVVVVAVAGVGLAIVFGMFAAIFGDKK